MVKSCDKKNDNCKCFIIIVKNLFGHIQNKKLKNLNCLLLIHYSQIFYVMYLLENKLQNMSDFSIYIL